MVIVIIRDLEAFLFSTGHRTHSGLWVGQKWTKKIKYTFSRPLNSVYRYYSQRWWNILILIDLNRIYFLLKPLPNILCSELSLSKMSIKLNIKGALTSHLAGLQVTAQVWLILMDQKWTLQAGCIVQLIISVTKHRICHIKRSSLY